MMNTFDVCTVQNPLLAALADLVDSYDDETNQVSLVALGAARDVLSGHIPKHWLARTETL